MAAKKPTIGRRKLLGSLARQSREAYAFRNLREHPELAGLAYSLRCAHPRARSVNYMGVRFPILHTLCLRLVACPDTGMHLVGSVDL